MSAIRTNAAAAMLGVSPSTLRSWEGRFGHPAPRRSEGGHRKYELAEIEALREAIAQTGDLPAAVAMARERGEGPATDARLRDALARFDAERADRVMEESLALRSVGRTVLTVLLPAVEGLASGGAQGGEDARAGAGGPEYCFGWRYATGWLAAAQRVAPPATREQGVLIFDASGALQMDGLHVQALELLLRRGGLRVLALPVQLDSTRVGNALRALRPDAVVLAGSAGGAATLEAIGRLVYATRRSVGEVPVMDFRGAVPDTGASTVRRIGPDAGAASQALLDALTQPGRLARVS